MLVECGDVQRNTLESLLQGQNGDVSIQAVAVAIVPEGQVFHGLFLAFVSPVA